MLTSTIKADVHTPNFVSRFLKLIFVGLPRFSKICNVFTDFVPILAWMLLEISKDFVSADKFSVRKIRLDTFSQACLTRQSCAYLVFFITHSVS